MERRTPLARGTKGLKRTPLARGSSSLARKAMKRTAMKPSQSPAAHSAAEWEQRIIPVLMRRCGGRCERCGAPLSSVPWSVHHRRPRGMGGTSLSDIDDYPNLMVLCGTGTTGDHGWVESNRQEAYRDGLLVRKGHDPALAPVLYRGDWRLLTRDGRVVDTPHVPRST